MKSWLWRKGILPPGKQKHYHHKNSKGEIFIIKLGNLRKNNRPNRDFKNTNIHLFGIFFSPVNVIPHAFTNQLGIFTAMLPLSIEDSKMDITRRTTQTWR